MKPLKMFSSNSDAFASELLENLKNDFLVTINSESGKIDCKIFVLTD